MRFSLGHPETEDRAAQQEDSRGSIFHTLLYTVLQKPREGNAGAVVALGSSNLGEGVTYVARALLHELAKCELTSVAGLNVSFLRKLHEPTVEAIRKYAARPAVRSTIDARPEVRAEVRDKAEAAGRLMTLSERRGPWEGSWQYRRDCIDLLRSEFDYSIIDCPSLEESGDLLSIAPFVDGVILVVEANRTRREQPRQAEQRIGAAGGTVLGYILNKQTCEVPRWLYPDA
jgi:hypothetical protein